VSLTSYQEVKKSFFFRWFEIALGLMTSQSIHIRPADQNDANFILSLVPRLTEFGPPIWRDRDAMIAIDQGVLEAKLSSMTPDSIILLAESEDGRKFGFIHLQEASDYYHPQKYAHIADLIVDASAESRGVARALIERAEGWARDRGYEWLSLNVFADNMKARSLYKKLGFGEDVMKYIKILKR
jgi:GNAT superfamily N-acetyltransferase